MKTIMVEETRARNDARVARKQAMQRLADAALPVVADALTDTLAAIGAERVGGDSSLCWSLGPVYVRCDAVWDGGSKVLSVCISAPDQRPRTCTAELTSDALASLVYRTAQSVAECAAIARVDRTRMRSRLAERLMLATA